MLALIEGGGGGWSRDAGRSIIGGGGHVFIYSCYAQLISFEIEIKILKSIVFTVCDQEYMNMCPPPPKYRSSGVPGGGEVVQLGSHGNWPWRANETVPK